MRHSNWCGKRQSPPMKSIPVDHPFQIVGIDIMELPLTTNGNKYAIVFQDLFTKWPMVYAAPDQKATRLAKKLVNEIVPMFDVPKDLLSDRGTNLLSCLIQDVCKLLGTKKLNTTAHHLQCNGMVERFNRTLKTMLRKHVSQFGMQWVHTYPVYYGPIAIHHTHQLVKNHHSYCLSLTAVTLQKQPHCQQNNSMQLTLPIIVRASAEFIIC